MGREAVKIPVIHRNWSEPAEIMTDGFSLEITAKDVDALREASPNIPGENPIAITFLPGEDFNARIAATRTVRELGFEPMPHFSARRIRSEHEFQDYLGAVVEQANVRRCFVVAGDPATPEGPYSTSGELIESGAFDQLGITAIGIGGHPEGHPNMDENECFNVLQAKRDAIESRGMAPLIVTQFAFDADRVLAWLAVLRRRGIDAPVRLGVPGPAGIKTLLRFAKRCGVGASASVMTKYGVSLSRLMGSAGPDKLVDSISQGLGPEHGAVRLHFYPFGGVARTVEWINDYAARHSRSGQTLGE